MSILNELGRRLFHSLGYEVKRITPPQAPKPTTIAPDQTKRQFTMPEGLARASKRELDIRTVIDVGSSDGRWSRGCMDKFPNAYYFLFEGNTEHSDGLIKFKQEFVNSDYVLAACGDRQGEINFSVAGPLGGGASDTPFMANSAIVPMTTIDLQVGERHLTGPFLIKLDTHGFERQILEGGKDTLARTNLLIIEGRNFVKKPDDLRFHQLIGHLETLGFRCIDMVDLMLRPADQAFWQVDLFFVREDHPSFRSNSYRML